MLQRCAAPGRATTALSRRAGVAENPKVVSVSVIGDLRKRTQFLRQLLVSSRNAAIGAVSTRRVPGGSPFSGADAETAPSFLRLAAVQGIKCKQYLANVAPKGCFTSTEAIERVVIGETQKATRELSVGIDGRIDKCLSRARHGFQNPLCGRAMLVPGRNPVSLPEHRIDLAVSHHGSS